MPRMFKEAWMGGKLDGKKDGWRLERYKAKTRDMRKTRKFVSPTHGTPSRGIRDCSNCQSQNDAKASFARDEAVWDVESTKC